MTNAVDWYDAHAEAVAAVFEKGTFESVHGWLLHLLPSRPATVLDVGAGSGRDAVWLSAEGYEVVAVEPSRSMRSVAGRLHPDASVCWIDDRLPALDVVSRSGLSFDLILLSAVWMHVPAHERSLAFRNLVALLRPGGILAMSFRDGPANRATDSHSVSPTEIEALARDHGVETRINTVHQLRWKHLRWVQIAVGLPDRGAGACAALRLDSEP